MKTRGDSREFHRRIAERSTAPPKTVRYGENMRSMTAGSLSASLGIVVIAALANSMLGQAMGEWNIREYYGAVVMSSVGAMVAIAGMVLGGVGLMVGWKAARRISVLSAFGILSCYLAVMISLIYVLYHEGEYWLSSE